MVLHFIIRYSTIQNLSNKIINQWRDKIRHDASQFIIMCKEIQIQPDVDSLFEWTQYLAAAIAKVRFDTIFYIAALPNTYSCLIANDDHETVSAEV
jgi:nucleoside diphosphate-linked moiety X motif protein 19